MGKNFLPMAAKNGTGSILAIKQYTRALMPFSVEQERLEELRQRCPPERLA